MCVKGLDTSSLFYFKYDETISPYTSFASMHMYTCMCTYVYLPYTYVHIKSHINVRQTFLASTFHGFCTLDRAPQPGMLQHVFYLIRSKQGTEIRESTQIDKDPVTVQQFFSHTSFAVDLPFNNLMLHCSLRT